MEWKFERHGCNVVTVHDNNRNMVCTAEYDFDKHWFNFRSSIRMTQHFTYKGRCYNRMLRGNETLYRKLLRTIGTDTFNRIAAEIDPK